MVSWCDAGCAEQHREAFCCAELPPGDLHPGLTLRVCLSPNTACCSFYGYQIILIIKTIIITVTSIIMIQVDLLISDA